VLVQLRTSSTVVHHPRLYELDRSARTARISSSSFQLGELESSLRQIFSDLVDPPVIGQADSRKLWL
jgi:hypothetical protein